MKTHNLKFAKGSRTKNAPTCPCGKSNRNNPHFNPFEGFNGEYGFCHGCPEDEALHMPGDTEKERFVYKEPPRAERKYVEEPMWNSKYPDVLYDMKPEKGVPYEGQHEVTYFYRNFFGKLTTAKRIVYNMPEFKRVKEKTPQHLYTMDSGYYGCLFYEYDLAQFPNATVILVESEKTAAFLRHKFKAYLSEFIYLATCGANGLTNAKIEHLQNRRVLICYDCDNGELQPDGTVKGSKGREGAQSAHLKLSAIAKPIVIDIDPTATDGTDLGDIITDIDIDYIRGLENLAVDSTPIPEGLPAALRELNREAIPLDGEVIGKLGEQFPVDGDKIRKLNKTVQALYSSEYGINKASMVQKIEVWLDQHYEFRRNVITSHVLCRPKAAPTWKMCNSSELWRHIHHNLQDFGKKAKIPRSDIDNIIESEFIPDWNPLTDYFEGLPAWDGIDHIDALANHVHCEDQEFWNAQFKKAMVRSVACALGEFDNRIVMVLVSEKQNLGKSWFIRNLCPPALESEYYKETPLTHDKDSHIALTENFIWNLEELDDLNRKEIAALKAIISTSRVKERRAYARYETSMRRIVNFWGSTNKTEFLTDTENTRWLCFNILGVDHNYSNKQSGVKNIDIDKVWAQAYHLFRSKFNFQLSVEEKEVQAVSNRNFETMTAEKHLILRHFRPAKAGEPLAEFMANLDINEILTKTTQASRMNIDARNIGRAMSQLGFKQERKTINSKTVRGYWVRYNQAPAQYEHSTQQTEMFPVDDEAVELPF